MSSPSETIPFARPPAAIPSPVERPPSGAAIPAALRRSAVGAVVVLLVMLGSGLLVRLAVTGTALGDADLDVTRWFADHRNGVLDSVATVGSSLADTYTVLGVLVGAVTMLLAARHARHAVFLMAAVSTEFLVFLATSLLIARDRPAVQPLGEVPSTGSYPSGHVAVTIVLYGGLAIVAASISGRRDVRRLGLCATALLAVLVGGSRLYEGVHHPIDLLGGVLLGVAALVSTALAFGLVSSPSHGQRRTVDGRPSVATAATEVER